MRFYQGYIYDVRLAVWPEGVDYQIMDVISDNKHKSAYIQVGHGRELDVKANAKLIWRENEKTKIISIPFVKINGRLVFDLPEYLRKRNIRFKLYKKLKNCAGDSWNTVTYSAIICRAGEIGWGSDWCIDYREYWLSVEYRNNFPELEDKRVKSFIFRREIVCMNTAEILSWFKATMENRTNISYEEFGKLLEAWGIRKESPFIEIEFFDGSRLEGSEIWGACN